MARKTRIVKQGNVRHIIPVDDDAEVAAPAAAPTAAEDRLPKIEADAEDLYMDQLWACRDLEKYYHPPSGKFLSAATVDKSIGRGASARLMKMRAVSATIWAPGLDLIVRDKRLISESGWVDAPGAMSLNIYRPPLDLLPGADPAQAERWLAHVQRLWPDDWQHIIRWMAHRAQRPWQKINHSMVLGGRQGIGKDSALEPLKMAVGMWNFRQTSPREITHPIFNPYVKSVVLCVDEARDLGTESDRYRFYETMKTLCAAPPDVLMMNDKHEKAIGVLNVTGVLYTTNHKSGLHMPSDDRRHFVAWSDLIKEDFAGDERYFPDLWSWFTFGGGLAHCVAFLRGYDIEGWDCKAPPPKTAAFWEMVLADQPEETSELAGVIRHLSQPDAVTLDEVRAAASFVHPDFSAWAKERKNVKALAHRLEEAGYAVTKNDTSADGRWWIGSQNVNIYTRRRNNGRERYAAALALRDRLHAAAVALARAPRTPCTP